MSTRRRLGFCRQMSSSQCQWYQFMRAGTSIKSYRRWQMSRIAQHRVDVLIEALAANPAIYQLYTHLREPDLAASDRIYFMVLLQSITRWRRAVIDLSTDNVSPGQSVHGRASAAGRGPGADCILCLSVCGSFPDTMLSVFLKSPRAHHTAGLWKNDHEFKTILYPNKRAFLRPILMLKGEKE